MLTRETQQGTTLAICAPYFAYGLEVQCLDDNEIYSVLGWEFDELKLIQPGKVFDGQPTTAFNNCLPVLRPFSALCTPLEDGTVPLFEAAKLAIEHEAADLFFRTGYKVKPVTRQAWFGKGGSEIAAYEVWGENTACSIFTLQADWSASCQVPGKVWRAFDYLRSQHFAVGLEPHQYIAKAPAPAAAPTTEEKGGSREQVL